MKSPNRGSLPSFSQLSPPSELLKVAESSPPMRKSRPVFLSMAMDIYSTSPGLIEVHSSVTTFPKTPMPVRAMVSSSFAGSLLLIFKVPE